MRSPRRNVPLDSGDNRKETRSAESSVLNHAAASGPICRIKPDKVVRVFLALLPGKASGRKSVKPAASVCPGEGAYGKPSTASTVPFVEERGCLGGDVSLVGPTLGR